MKTAHTVCAIALSVWLPALAFAAPASHRAHPKVHAKAPKVAPAVPVGVTPVRHHGGAVERRVHATLTRHHAESHTEPSAAELASATAPSASLRTAAPTLAALPAVPTTREHAGTAPRGHQVVPAAARSHRGHAPQAERASTSTRVVPAATTTGAGHKARAGREAHPVAKPAVKPAAADEKAPPRAGLPAVAPAHLQCGAQPVEFVRDGAHSSVRIARCDGTVDPVGTARLSQWLQAPIQAGQVAAVDAKPTVLDSRLVAKLQTIAAHFGREGRNARLEVVSSVRPNAIGSNHAIGRAMDVRVAGVANEALVAFCKSLPDTGCGYYPNSSFVHVDARDAGAGLVTWIDASRPGETPRYVKQWPEVADAANSGSRLAAESPQSDAVEVAAAPLPAPNAVSPDQMLKDLAESARQTTAR